MLAARNGSAAAVDVLIEEGAKVSATTPQGTTVLMQVRAAVCAVVVVVVRWRWCGGAVLRCSGGGTVAKSHVPFTAVIVSSRAAAHRIVAGCGEWVGAHRGCTPRSRSRPERTRQEWRRRPIDRSVDGVGGDGATSCRWRVRGPCSHVFSPTTRPATRV